MSTSKWVEEFGLKKGQIQPRLIAGEKPQEKEQAPYIIRVGGMDLAKRVDHSAFIVLRLEKLKDGDFYFWIEAQMEWPHVNYKTIAAEALEIMALYPMDKIGFDRSGVGDAASELFDKVTLPLEPIVTSQPNKLDMISILTGLITSHKIKFNPETARKIMDQAMGEQKVISDAGNILYRHPPNQHNDLFWALCYACFVGLPYVVGFAQPTITGGPPKEEPYLQKDEAGRLIHGWFGTADEIAHL